MMKIILANRESETILTFWGPPFPRSGWPPKITRIYAKSTARVLGIRWRRILYNRKETFRYWKMYIAKATHRIEKGLACVEVSNSTGVFNVSKYSIATLTRMLVRITLRVFGARTCRKAWGKLAGRYEIVSGISPHLYFWDGKQFINTYERWKQKRRVLKEARNRIFMLAC